MKGVGMLTCMKYCYACRRGTLHTNNKCNECAANMLQNCSSEAYTCTCTGTPIRVLKWKEISKTL